MRGFYLLCLLSATLLGCTVAEKVPLSRNVHSEEGALAADISDDGTLAIISGLKNGIKIWDLATNTERFSWAMQGDDPNVVGLVKLSFDKQYAVTADMESFALWSLQSGEPEGLWRIDEASIRDIAVSNNGRAVLVGRANGKVMFFEPRTGRRVEFLGHTEKVNSLDLSPNGRYALSGGNDYTAYLWDTQTGQVIHAFNHSSRVTKVALDPRGRYAFTADSRKGARIWNVQNGEELSELRYIERQKIFSDAVFSTDGQYLLTGSPTRRVSLWRVEDGSLLKEWEVKPKDGPAPQSAVVYAVGFMDNQRIISESSSGLAEVWSLED